MIANFPESDWKVFREIRAVALERFCQRVLEELDRVRSDTSRSYHERYKDTYRLLEDRDRDLAAAFDNPRRSTAHRQLALIHQLDLVRPAELARLTPETRQAVESANSGIV